MIYTVLSISSGAALLALVFYDVYSTILRATKRPGPISENLNRAFWWTATRCTGNLSRRWRHRLLTAVGPLLLPFLIALLILFLDIRGENGFVVAAPSLHRNGNRYSWMNETPTLPLPTSQARFAMSNSSSFGAKGNRFLIAGANCCCSFRYLFSVAIRLFS